MKLGQFEMAIERHEHCWLVTCYAIAPAVMGSGPTLFAALDDWKNQVVARAINEFIEEAKKR